MLAAAALVLVLVPAVLAAWLQGAADGVEAPLGEIRPCRCHSPATICGFSS